MLEIIKSTVNTVTHLQEQSKHSGIPSVNVCMNCHKSIAEVAENTVVVLEDRTLQNKQNYDKEIPKLYKAAGWDAEEPKYTGETRASQMGAHSQPARLCLFQSLTTRYCCWCQIVRNVTVQWKRWRLCINTLL